MNSDHITWVVVADGEHARVLQSSKSAGPFHTIRSIDSASAHHRSSDLGTDAPGRSFESGNVTRHAIQPRSDPHVAAKHAFADWLAGEVNEAAGRHEYQRLVLVAPAHVLHDLREKLDSKSSALLVATMQKDLIKTPDADIVEHLSWEATHLAEAQP